jgi:hydroxymethylglutaryl-CoA reductase (NADPH)
MAIQHRQASASLRGLLDSYSPEQLLDRLTPKHHAPASKFPRGIEMSGSKLDARWDILSFATNAREELLDERTRDQALTYAGHIENFIGTVKVPVGVIGPVRVNGAFAQGDYYVPLATTEAALVASYGRGAQLMTAAGGCAAVVTKSGVGRAPGFAFRTIYEAGQFIAWVLKSLPEIESIAASTSRFVQLTDTQVSLEGNHVYLFFEFHTGDAAGQNMVTIASQAICEFIARESPVQPRHTFLEVNNSGDKKSSAQSFLLGRGRSVTADVVIPAAAVEEGLHATPAMMAEYFRMAVVGGSLSGTIGIQGHIANGLAAMFLACGQDVACVAECAVGITRIEETDDGSLYGSVTLPNLVVGTVGGGTALPSQHACLDIMGLAGDGHANAFAELCAAVALGGELSIVGALVAHEFAQAHERLARRSMKLASAEESRLRR